jgi:hypothetical protein
LSEPSNLARNIFIVSAVILMTAGFFVLGIISHKQYWPTARYFDRAWGMVSEVVNPSILRLEANPVRNEKALEVYQPDAMQPGLLLMMMDLGDRENAVRVIDRTGRIIHEWRPLWLDLWPDGEGNFDDEVRPVKGTSLHGLEITPEASIVSNFEYLSTFSLDVCGNTLWKLDNLGHHSVHRNEDGSFWVPAMERIKENPVGFKMHRATFDSFLIQHISADGRILESKSLTEMLGENDLYGLTVMSSLEIYNPSVFGDTMHLNDIEAFPSDMESDVFAPGDLLLSLRNLNGLMVVDPKNWKVKWSTFGHVLRQHDGDFMAGDRISVFDNRNFGDPEPGDNFASRIVEFDVKTGANKTVLSGDGALPFFTQIRGVHQRLANGNILITSANDGMVAEFSADGRPVWRFEHRVAPDKNRKVYHARVLPPEMDEAFFKARSQTCRAKPAG